MGEQGGPGDNIGMNVKGLDKQNMPRTGDVMVYKKDTSLGACANFNAQIQVLDIPGEIKVGYSPIGFVRCGRSACRVSKIVWKIGKETGGKKMEEPHSLKSNEMAECNFVPQQPLVSTPSRTARASRAWPSWTETAWSCSARSSPASARRMLRMRARRSEHAIGSLLYRVCVFLVSVRERTVP